MNYSSRKRLERVKIKKKLDSTFIMKTKQNKNALYILVN